MRENSGYPTLIISRPQSGAQKGELSIYKQSGYQFNAGGGGGVSPSGWMPPPDTEILLFHDLNSVGINCVAFLCTNIFWLISVVKHRYVIYQHVIHTTCQ